MEMWEKLSRTASWICGNGLERATITQLLETTELTLEGQPDFAASWRQLSKPSYDLK